MRKLTSLIILLMPVFCMGQSLKITVYNPTHYDIDSVHVDSIFVGSIKKKDSAVVLNCTKLKMQDDIPCSLTRAAVKNKIKFQDQKGSQVISKEKPVIVTSGDYKFDLFVDENNIFFNGRDMYRVTWKKHIRVKKKATK